jgi:CheY-like chemotaxis protein
MKESLEVLVVEDEFLVAMVLEQDLLELGYKVCGSVATGEEAVIIAAQNRPDVILMDIRLAGKIDGIEAAKIIGDQHNVPVIFMTGYSDEELTEFFGTSQSATVLTKPIQVYQVAAAIDSLLGL